MKHKRKSEALSEKELVAKKLKVNVTRKPCKIVRYTIVAKWEIGRRIATFSKVRGRICLQGLDKCKKLEGVRSISDRQTEPGVAL